MNFLNMIDRPSVPNSFDACRRMRVKCVTPYQAAETAVVAE
jgi:hypothetical protein